MKACCRCRISHDRQCTARERNEHVSREKRLPKRDALKDTHECCQDKALNGGLSELAVAGPSNHQALAFLQPEDILPCSDNGIIPGFVKKLQRKLLHTIVFSSLIIFAPCACLWAFLRLLINSWFLPAALKKQSAATKALASQLPDFVCYVVSF